MNSAVTQNLTEDSMEIPEVTDVDTDLENKDTIYTDASPERINLDDPCYFGFFFAAPKNQQHLFFVGNCWLNHSHQRIYIFDRKEKKLTGFLSLPGNLRSVATRDDTVFLLVFEPKGIKWSENGHVTFSPISEVKKCFLSMIPRPDWERGATLRLASFNGAKVCNLLDNR